VKVSQVNQGILWFMSSRLSFALAGIVIKLFPENSALQFNFIRAAFIMLLVVPVIFIYNRKELDWRAPFKSKNPSLMVIRVVLGTIGLICFYYTFQTMTFAKAITIASASTFLTPLFAKFFLGETIGVHRMIAISVGYIGVWYALDPMYSGIDIYEIIALINVILTASVQTISKKILIKDKPFVLMFYTAMFSVFMAFCTWSSQAPITAITGFDAWPTLTLTGFVVLLFCMGPFSFMGQFGYLKAFKKVDLSLLMPYDYTNFVFAALFGYFIFNEIPDVNTWVAMGLIILATALLTIYETRNKRKRI
jgi:drug/metabolite transporter (DMT)-like permease